MKRGQAFYYEDELWRITNIANKNRQFKDEGDLASDIRYAHIRLFVPHKYRILLCYVTIFGRNDCWPHESIDDGLKMVRNARGYYKSWAIIERIL